MSYKQKSAYGLSVYLNLRKEGIAPKAALQIAALSARIPARSLRRWRDISLRTGALPQDRRGKVITGQRRWMLALIGNEEEDLSRRLAAWVRDNTGKRDRPNCTLREVTNFINDTLLKKYIDEQVAGVHRITDETARDWLKKLGFHYKKSKSGVYCDKHEAPENLEARAAYIAKIDKILAENKEIDTHNAAIKAQVEAIDKELNDASKRSEGTHHDANG